MVSAQEALASRRRRSRGRDIPGIGSRRRRQERAIISRIQKSPARARSPSRGLARIVGPMCAVARQRLTFKLLQLKRQST
jgi:hypothetical protein